MCPSEKYEMPPRKNPIHNPPPCLRSAASTLAWSLCPSSDQRICSISFCGDTRMRPTGSFRAHSFEVVSSVIERIFVPAISLIELNRPFSRFPSSLNVETQSRPRSSRKRELGSDPLILPDRVEPPVWGIVICP